MSQNLHVVCVWRGNDFNLYNNNNSRKIWKHPYYCTFITSASTPPSEGGTKSNLNVWVRTGTSDESYIGCLLLIKQRLLMRSVRFPNDDDDDDDDDSLSHENRFNLYNEDFYQSS